MCFCTCRTRAHMLAAGRVRALARYRSIIRTRRAGATRDGARRATPRALRAAAAVVCVCVWAFVLLGGGLLSLGVVLERAAAIQRVAMIPEGGLRSKLETE